MVMANDIGIKIHSVFDYIPENACNRLGDMILEMIDDASEKTVNEFKSYVRCLYDCGIVGSVTAYRFMDMIEEICYGETKLERRITYRSYRDNNFMEKDD